MKVDNKQSNMRNHNGVSTVSNKQYLQIMYSRNGQYNGCKMESIGPHGLDITDVDFIDNLRVLDGRD